MPSDIANSSDIIGRSSGQGFKFRDAWAPTTSYAPYDVVTYNGRTYLSRTTFTSGTQFNVANWALLADKGNSQVAYAERLSNFTALNPVANTAYDITGLSVNYTADGTRTILIEVFLPGVAFSAGGAGTPDINCWLLEGATILQAVTKTQVAAGKATDFQPRRLLTPSAGLHTYKVQIRSATGGASTSLFSVGDPAYPQFIRIIEV